MIEIFTYHETVGDRSFIVWGYACFRPTHSYECSGFWKITTGGGFEWMITPMTSREANSILDTTRRQSEAQHPIFVLASWRFYHGSLLRLETETTLVKGTPKIGLRTILASTAGMWRRVLWNCHDCVFVCDKLRGRLWNIWWKGRRSRSSRRVLVQPVLGWNPCKYSSKRLTDFVTSVPKRIDLVSGVKVAVTLTKTGEDILESLVERFVFCINAI